MLSLKSRLGGVVNKVNKKRILFPLVFFSEIAIVIIIAKIFGLETENSLLGWIYAFVMVLTIIWFLIKIIIDHKAKLSTAKVPLLGTSVIVNLYFIIALLIIALVALIASGLLEVIRVRLVLQRDAELNTAIC